METIFGGIPNKKLRLFMNDCIIYRKILSICDVDKLQRDLHRLGKRTVEN
jgi:hypothetical protein